MNLFDNLAKTTTTAKNKKDDKLTIKIVGEEFDNNLKRFSELKKESEIIKTELDMVQTDLKDTTIQKWFDLYSKNGSYPGSAVVSSDSDSSFMFSPSDKYLTIDETRSIELKEKYGDDIITEDIVYTFDPTLLEKYSGILSNFIINSPDIAEEDKTRLIKASKKLFISKGSIEKAFTWGKGKISEYIEDISPIFSLRTPKIKD